LCPLAITNQEPTEPPTIEADVEVVDDGELDTAH